MIYYYTAFGLIIKSELVLDELLSHSSTVNEEYDVTINLGLVNPRGLPNATSTKRMFYQVTSTQSWFYIPDVARFLVMNGNQIIIEPLTDINARSIKLFVLNTCFGILLMQRNLFLLHGNAIKINGDQCISFLGNSGAGKSTLSGAFFKRGYSILADDICAINSENLVIPSFPRIKLCPDAAQKLQIDTCQLDTIMPNVNKFSIALGEQFCLTTPKIKMVYVLETHDQENIMISPLIGIKKLEALINNLYCKQYLTEQISTNNTVKQCMHIGSQINIACITRPKKGFKLDELVNTIEADFIQRRL